MKKTESAKMKLKEDEDERTLRETVDRCYKQGKCKGKMKLNEMKNNRQKKQTGTREKKEEARDLEELYQVYYIY